MTAWSILETGADETFDGKVVTLGHSGTRSPSRAGFFAPACFYTPAFVALLATSAFCATISGRVSESSTDLPIPGAVVRVQSSSSLTRFTLSDSTGAFAFDGLERGDWMLSAEMVGYRPWRRAISLDEESSVVAVQLETQPLRMEPMVVWAQRGGEDRHTPAYVETIPIETLQAPGADLAQALDVATNVNVRRYGGLGSFSTLSIRGSTSEQVQVYLDGVLLNQALGGGVNLGNLPLAGLESVQIYRGATPARFGGNSLGGVVHLRTSSLSRSKKTYVRTTAGSFGTHHLDASVAGPWRDWEYLALANLSTSENDFRFWDDNGTAYNPNDDGWAHRANSDFHSFRLLTKLGRRFGGNLVQVHNTLDLSHSGISGIGVHQAKHTRLDSWRKLSEANLHGTLVRGFGGYAVRAYHSLQTSEYKDLKNEIGVGTQHDRNTTTSVGVRGEINGIIPSRGLFTLFGSGLYENFEPVNLIQSARKSIHSRRYRSSLGGEMESLPLLRRFTLTAGAQIERLDNRLLTHQEVVTNAFQRGRHDTETVWGFRIGTGIELAEDVHLKAHRGRYQRPPNFFELFGDRGSVVGNPDLASEQGEKWDVGLGIRNMLGGVVRRGELVYYKNSIKNLIRFVQSTQQVSEPHNIDETALSGLETRFNLRIDSRLSLGGNYVYQRARSRAPFSYERGNDLPNAPRHRFGFELSASWSGNGFRYSFNRESRSFIDRANLNPVPARSVHGVGIDFPLIEGIRITMEVRNMGNNQIADVWGYPLPGRSYFVSAALDRSSN